MKTIVLSKWCDREASARKRARKLLKLGQAKLTMSNKYVLVYEVPDYFVIYTK